MECMDVRGKIILIRERHFLPVNSKFVAGDVPKLSCALIETMEVPVTFTRDMLTLFSGALTDGTGVPSTDIS